MAVVDRFKDLFKKKPQDADLDSGLSLGMPDGSTYQAPPELVSNEPLPLPQGNDQPTTGQEEEPVAADLINLAPLGKKTVAQHQRTLSILMGLALVLLVGAVLFGLSGSDQVARQVAATTQAQLESQRLVRLMSQALMGEAKVFPEVAQSAQVLTRAVRGLAQGDSELRVDQLGDVHLASLATISPAVERTDKNIATLLAQQKSLSQDRLRLECDCASASRVAGQNPGYADSDGAAKRICSEYCRGASIAGFGAEHWQSGQ